MKLNDPKHWEHRARPDGFLFQQQQEKTMAQKPVASEYTDLKEYIKDKKEYARAMGKNPNKVALHYYKEQGIYSIQDLLDHREQNPWAKGLDL
tara:strand:+ start:315 stop:593 length:279 start_codon:yes stop_codon:yes gene_type:complete